MYQIEYSPNLKGEVLISWSKNAALPIVAANYILDNKVKLLNKPEISDIKNLEKLAEIALSKKENYLDLTDELSKKFRSSIMLIPFWLLKYGEVKFGSVGGCNIGKRSLDTFDDALTKAGIEIKFNTKGEKIYKVIKNPKKHIMLQEFSVTTIEAIITYLAFAQNYDYEITIYQVATEPHVKNLIAFLNNAWANITMEIDHTILIKPCKKIKIKKPEFEIIGDYITAGTYFAIGACCDNSEITIKNINVDDLSAMYNIAEKIGINFKILDKHTLLVNSFNKANYKATKLQTMIFPWFPTDLQSAFGTIFTQCTGISKIQETLFEGRFSYLSELENFWAKIEILNPHEAIIIGKTKLKGCYATSRDLRGWAAMVIAGLMAKGTTYVTNEALIERGYDHIIQKLTKLWANIKLVEDQNINK